MKMATFKLLAALSNGSYSAAEIRERISDLAGGGRQPSLASFYRILNSAVSEGWIEVADSKQASESGRPAHSYEVTAAGVTEMRREANLLRELTNTALGELSPTSTDE